MSDPAQIEQELREFLEIEDNIRKGERLTYLMAIINKHFAMDKVEHMIIDYDLTDIISGAKSAYPKATMPMYISKREFGNVEFNYVLVLESFIGYLNKNKLLKRLVKFDYRR